MMPLLLALVSLAVSAGCGVGGRVDTDGFSHVHTHGHADQDAGPAHDASSRVRVAVIGDYGQAGPDEADVALLVEQFDPDYVLTTGDNNYPSGDEATIDRNVGQYYARWIHPYLGIYGDGATENRFFPSLGNHDWGVPGAAPYLSYFVLPGNERYYDVALGPVHFFCVDSDAYEPDGIEVGSRQAEWLREALAASTAPFRIVLQHHPPLSSALEHGSDARLQWPFRQWGATAVLAGHDHTYEHVIQEGVHYVISGLGGRSRYPYAGAVSGSRMFYNEDFGALFIEADETRATFEFVTRARQVVDAFTIRRTDEPTLHENLVPAGAAWRYRTYGVDPGEGWTTAGLHDADWPSGNAPLGHGDGDERTILYGTPSDARGVSAVFRHAFEVEDPSRVVDLYLGVVRDDGAVVYLNGAEVLRANMPDGEISPSTWAPASVEGTRETGFFGGTIDPGLLVSGTNVVAAEIHQAQTGADDLSFDLVLDAIVGDVVLARGSSWHFYDGPSAPDGWREPEFDDSDWAEGPGPLGYGEPDLATTISFGPDRNDVFVAAFFRRRFDVPDPAAADAIHMRLRRDDAAIVYLNGVEIFRSNLTQGEVHPSGLAASDVLEGVDSAWLETVIAPDAFVAGENVMAVEIRQASSSGRDLSFDLELLVPPEVR